MIDSASEAEGAARLTDPKVFTPTWSEAVGAFEEAHRFLPGAQEVSDFFCLRDRTGRAQVLHDLVHFPQRWVVHSPTGYEWGYGGSGPAELALNILGRFVPPAEAWRLHHHFKAAFVARLPQEGGVIEARAVREWIQAQWDRDEVG